MYATLKLVHVATVHLTILLFLARMVLRFFQPAWLQWKVIKILPHVIDTVLLVSALWLAWVIHQYPFVHGWLTAKVLGLAAYIVFGAFAIKRAKTKGGAFVAMLLALATFSYIYMVARSKHVMPWEVLF